jgi:mRNA interferase RelE/StbE
VDYLIQLSGLAKEELQNIQFEYRQKILRKIESLQKDPRPRGTKKLSGKFLGYRIRQGPYRIFFSVDDDRLIVQVRSIRLRKDAYR